jgi:peroxiredoxin
MMNKELSILIFCCSIMLAFSGDRLIGTVAPEWSNQQWINSTPLRITQLKGKVVLIRFFMESTCPYCRASAPYLNQLYSHYRDKGFVVLGMYTPKPAPRQTSLKTVQRYVKDYGFQFPVALDNDWNALNSYWLDRVPDADYTSASFLIDKKGIVRYIHPGGSYNKEDFTALLNNIETLIKE